MYTVQNMLHATIDMINVPKVNVSTNMLQFLEDMLKESLDIVNVSQEMVKGSVDMINVIRGMIQDSLDMLRVSQDMENMSPMVW
jgi:hypothetical protein